VRVRDVDCACKEEDSCGVGVGVGVGVGETDAANLSLIGILFLASKEFAKE
jgi:hypothetical protein